MEQGRGGRRTARNRVSRAGAVAPSGGSSQLTTRPHSLRCVAVMKLRTVIGTAATSVLLLAGAQRRPTPERSTAPAIRLEARGWAPLTLPRSVPSPAWRTATGGLPRPGRSAAAELGPRQELRRLDPAGARGLRRAARRL